MEIDLAISNLDGTISAIYGKYDPMCDAPLGYKHNFTDEEKATIKDCVSKIAILEDRKISRIEELCNS